MRKKLRFIITALCLLLAQATAYGAQKYPKYAFWPPETAVMQLPIEDYANWKVVVREVKKDGGKVECIPADQTNENWTDRICISFEDRKSFEKRIFPGHYTWVYTRDKSPLLAVDEGFPNISGVWQDSSIYELTHRARGENSWGNPIIRHEIARCVLTEEGYHHVQVIRRNGEISWDEREKIIALLKDGVAIVPYTEAYNQRECLSLTQRLAGLDFSDAFPGWEIDCHQIYVGIDNIEFTLCKSGQRRNNDPKVEHLKVAAKCIVNGTSIDPFFAMEKKKLSKQAKIQILERSPTEIIYSYTYVKKDKRCNAVVRSFVADQGYYTIACTNEDPNGLENEKILEWRERLERLKICEEATIFDEIDIILVKGKVNSPRG